MWVLALFGLGAAISVSGMRSTFIKVYAAFLAILIFFAAKKSDYPINPILYLGDFSPLSLLRWVLLGIMVIYSIHYNLTHRRSFTRSNTMLVTGAIVFLAYVLFSSQYAAFYPERALLRALSVVLLFVVVAYGFKTYFADMTNCLEFVQFMYRVTWIVIGTGFALWLLGFRELTTGWFGRYLGVFGNPGQLSNFIVLCTPIAMFHLYTRQEKLLPGALLFMMLVSLFLSGYRTGAVATLFAILSYAFLVNPRSRLTYFFLFSMGLFLLLITPELTRAVERFLSKGDVSIWQSFLISRFIMWTELMPYFLGEQTLWHRILFGYGFDNSREFTKFIVGHIRYLHNSYLEVLGDLGLVGLTLLLLILAGVARRAIQLMFEGRHPLFLHLHITFVTIFFAGLIDAFADSWMFSVGNNSAVMFWVPAAAIVARWSMRGAEGTSDFPPRAQIAPALPRGAFPEGGMAGSG